MAGCERMVEYALYMYSKAAWTADFRKFCTKVFRRNGLELADLAQATNSGQALRETPDAGVVPLLSSPDPIHSASPQPHISPAAYLHAVP